MKFLIDENMRLSFAEILRGLGYEAVHAFEVGLDETDDSLIMKYAATHQQIIVTFDLDFSRLIALGNFQFPSVITFRTDSITADFFSQVMSIHLENLKEQLTEGAMVTITDRNIRVKKLPVK